MQLGYCHIICLFFQKRSFNIMNMKKQESSLLSQNVFILTFPPWCCKLKKYIILKRQRLYVTSHLNMIMFFNYCVLFPRSLGSALIVFFSSFYFSYLTQVLYCIFGSIFTIYNFSHSPQHFYSLIITKVNIIPLFPVKEAKLHRET